MCVIELCWKYLLKSGENKADVKSAAQLSVLTKQYADLQSIPAMIRHMANDAFWIEKITNEQERIDDRSFFVLNVARHWFDYKLPKWLSVVSELQEYVFKKHNLPFGNYSFFATSLEHKFLPSNLAALLEYDIPYSAINKLKRILPQDQSPEMLIVHINKMPKDNLLRLGLLPYEIKKLKKAF